MPNGGRGVPARWENYSNIGKVLTGTRFIPFKVPLNDNLLAQVPEGTDNTWGLAKLKTTCPQLKHIIDLTATHRFGIPDHVIFITILFLGITTDMRPLQWGLIM